MKKTKIIMKAVVFLAIAGAIFVWINYLVQPIWKAWNNIDTIEGFYTEPENTIETVFLGTSVTINSITPSELYEEYGICSYNLATQVQSVFLSYTWLQEAYRLHSETLDTVVFDVSGLRREEDDSFTRKGLDGMQVSKVKLAALYDYTANANDFFTYLFPVLSYHERWKEFSKEDFTKDDYVPQTFYRGYNPRRDTCIETKNSYKEIAIPTYYLDEEAEPSTFLDRNLEYFDKMVQFCREKNIELVLMKSPQYGAREWTSADHNAAQDLANQYGLRFIDTSVSPYLEELDYNVALDAIDQLHMNYRGASKYTKLIGQYLMENLDNVNVKGKSRYEFMEEELEQYNRKIAKAKRKFQTAEESGEWEFDEATKQRLYLYEQACENEKLKEYIKYELDEDDYAGYIQTFSEYDNYAIFVSGKDAKGYPYLAVMRNGEILEEETGSESETIQIAGINYQLISGKTDDQDISSIVMESKEYSSNEPGLHVAVYDNITETMVDTHVFQITG